MVDENEAVEQVEQPGPETGADVKPTDTLEFWKAQARKNESAMKANRKELDALKAQLQGSKSVEERLAALEDENAALKAAKARADMVREVATATGISESIVSALNGTDADALTAQAQAIATMRTSPAPMADEAGRKPSAPKMTKDDIRSIKDKRERRAAIAANLDLYR